MKYSAHRDLVEEMKRKESAAAAGGMPSDMMKGRRESKGSKTTEPTQSSDADDMEKTKVREKLKSEEEANEATILHNRGHPVRYGQ